LDGKKQIESLLGKRGTETVRNLFSILRTYLYRTLRRLYESPSPEKNNNISIIKKYISSIHQVFFGYYDVTPFSGNDRYLLAMHAPTENIPPKPDTELSVGYYKLDKKEPAFIEVDKTTTWCWQQGCRLQWYPEQSSQEILYNKLNDRQYGCVIQNIKSRKVIKSFKKPIYALSRDGNWGISLNFSRLHRLRPGYGYINIPDNTEGQLAPINDGLWRINMHTGEELFLFSIDDISRFEPLASMSGAEHYFNHILFNPDGTRFMFFHVWMTDSKRYTRLITCNLDGEEKYALINEGHVSHYTWKSSNELLAYSTHNNTGRHYYLYKDESIKHEIIGKKILDQDGHPSYSSDGSLLLTDTYYDKYREQHLFLFNIGTHKLTSLGSFYSPFKYRGELRCDLHPRWSQNGKNICFDSSHEGKRAMYVLDVGNHFSCN
jgi:hypothetical protein